MGARDGLPMLLLNSSNEASVLDYAKSKNISSGVILGGESSVSAAFAEKLKKIKILTPNTGNVSDTRKKIVSLALDQVGKKYIKGTEGPTTFDCSGLVKYVYENVAGIKMPRVSRDQGNVGTAISRSELKPGDLIFWGNPIYHVAIYEGNNRIIQAANPNDGVMDGPLYGTPSIYRRIIND